MTTSDMVKYDTYKKMHDALSKALRNEFYYEAIFIEYAIFEDRLLSLIKHSGYVIKGKELCKDGSISIERKINIVLSHDLFAPKFIKNRLTPSLLDELKDWKNKRNKLIHALANIKYDEENAKEVALSGYDLLKRFKSKSQSVIGYFDKQNLVKELVN